MDGRSWQEFLALPVNPGEKWQGGVATFADLMGFSAPDMRSDAGIILWRGIPSDLLHARPVFAETDDVFDQFVDSMLELSQGHAFTHRPAEIDCNDRTFAEALNRRLDGSGTVVHYRATMDDWSEILAELAGRAQAARPETPSLREAGCSDDQLREYAAAAAEFHRAKLWDLLDDVDLIKIESPRPPHGMRYAVVLGAGGQSYGLGFYHSAEDHYGMMRQEIDPQEINVFSVLFESAENVVSEDFTLWQELDLPLATGELFPDAQIFSPQGPRRPTPEQIDCLTTVFKGLAATSEEELDSGRWTKPVELAGRLRNCKFSIPNLIDPPDRAEWARRGLMTDRRAHEIHFRRVQEFIDSVGDDMEVDELNEAIHAKFAGKSLDDYELPRNTPAERAEARYQDALACFGRRRVLLAREALAEDPSHVDACILVAESTRSAEAQIEMFQTAKQVAASDLGEGMEEMVGQFWRVHETRPYMRACHGLAVALAEAGQVGDAIEQYRDMLRLNPHDNQGVRYELVPLLLAQDRDAAAMQLLDGYAESSAMWLYAKAFVAFRGQGRSPETKKAVRAAFTGNAHVMQLVQSDEPPMMPDSYSPGSFEEAAICIEKLLAVWSETPGFLEWMFQEYVAWEQERAKRIRGEKRNTKKSKKSKGKRPR